MEEKKAKSNKGCFIVIAVAVLLFFAPFYMLIFKPGVEDLIAQEPDTPEAKKWFEKFFGFPSPPSTSNHYYAYYFRVCPQKAYF